MGKNNTEKRQGKSIDEQIIEMAQAGASRIECIKVYLFSTGAGLKESKEAVEKLHTF